jgi:hypothetical protein
MLIALFCVLLLPTLTVGVAVLVGVGYVVDRLVRS